MIKVGDKVKFDAFESIPGDVVRTRFITVGTVAYVNEKHGWFSVAYGNPENRTSFKICDIGKVVTIVGRG